MNYYSEKRDFIRMRVETAATFVLDGKTYDAVCVDLSSTGMQLETENLPVFSQEIGRASCRERV